MTSGPSSREGGASPESGGASRASGETPQTSGEMLRLAREFLGRKELEEARLEAELLVAHALELDRLGLFMQLDRPVSEAEVDLARALLMRRGRREPVAYLIGKREFYGRDFEVGPGVLVPRPETELLVDLARECFGGAEDEAELTVADLGTGSGCLAITLALELPGARVFASDISPKAIERARRNAERLGAAVETIEGDGVGALAPHAPFDLLVCNPPYIRPEERDGLPPEVRDHEPELALFAPAGDPDLWVRRLVEAASELVRPGGRLLVELGVEQGARALELARATDRSARLHLDLARIPRVLELEL